MIGVIELVQLVTTVKDCAVTAVHISQITTGHTRSSQSDTIFTSRCLVAAFNYGRSLSCGLPNCPQPQLHASHGSSSQQLDRRSSQTHQPTDCNKSKSLYDWRLTASQFVSGPSPLRMTTRNLSCLQHLSKDRVGNTVLLLQRSCSRRNISVCEAVT
jgi:hypothetical protein